MSGITAPRKRNVGNHTKVKTGCATCRIRKVKCDEDRPFCQKCVNTGRTCDGYESPFRLFNNQPLKSTRNSGATCDSSKLIRHTFEIAPQEIEFLNHQFSTKTMFDVKLECAEEARQVLQASLTDAPIKHAVSSLRALREDLEAFGDSPESVAQQTTIRDYGLQQYSMALRGLASDMSSPRSNVVKSALLCCQIFISIEQVRKNYAAMVQHIIRGLRIMHEYRARPELVSRERLLSAHHEQLPLLDVFIIKLFAAPCKFADPPVKADTFGTTLSICLTSRSQQSIKCQELRVLTPDIRTQLTKIASSTLEFLNKVSRVKSAGDALQLVPEKANLLSFLESWLFDLRVIRGEATSADLEPISINFLRLFHLILKIILLGALEFTPDLFAELRIENDRLQEMGNALEERVRTYTTCWGTNIGRME